jgi:hypothetical protein
MIGLPDPSQTGAGAGGGGATCTGVGSGAGAGGAVGGGGGAVVGGGGGAVVVVVVVVVDVVVDDVVVARSLVEAVCCAALPECASSRPSKTKADAEITAIAATSNPPINQRFRSSRPTLCGSAPNGPRLRPDGQPFFGSSRNGLPL